MLGILSERLTHIVAVNAAGELINERLSRQHQTSNKADRQVKVLRLQARYTGRQQLVQQAEMTVTAASHIINNSHIEHSNRDNYR